MTQHKYRWPEDPRSHEMEEIWVVERHGEGSRGYDWSWVIDKTHVFTKEADAREFALGNLSAYQKAHSSLTFRIAKFIRNSTMVLTNEAVPQLVWKDVVVDESQV